MKYVIPFIPKSLNIYAGRNNQWAYRAAKEEWLGIVDICCRPRPSEPIEKARVTLTYFFQDKRRRDPDNYCGKMILDGLTKAGILKDDAFTNIDLVLRGRVDSEQPRTEVEIEEC